MILNPYAGKPEKLWLAITQKLVASHPLKLDELRDAALEAWGMLWHTMIGTGKTSVRLSDLRVPATVVGYFFEVLLARELESRHPKLWKGTQSKAEKDIVYIPDPAFSVEIKASGQSGFKVFGNRNYGQKSENELLVQKEKSGFYITVNFYGQTLTLLRFGWIDADDWVPQKSQTGQMAGLKQAVYDYKLIPIPGAYRQHTSMIFLDGVGYKTAEDFAQLGIRTIGDLLIFTGDLTERLDQIKDRNQSFLDDCYDQL